MVIRHAVVGGVVSGVETLRLPASCAGVVIDVAVYDVAAEQLSS